MSASIHNYEGEMRWLPHVRRQARRVRAAQVRALQYMLDSTPCSRRAVYTRVTVHDGPTKKLHRGMCGAL